MTGRSALPLRALALSVSMFSVLPIPTRSGDSMRPQAAKTSPIGPAAGALLWLPLVGAVLGGLAVAPALAVWRGGSTGSTLLAAVLIMGALALLTRGLHLDGLADLADGLGSRRPAEQALQVMAKSDIGPFGVAAVMLALLVEAAALSAVLSAGSRPSGVVAVVLAVVIGRTAAVWAAGRGVPAARPGGFGALVAGSASWTARLSVTALALAAGAGAGWWAGLGGPGLIRLGASCLAALVLAWLVRRHAVRRLGGITGDVFGALIEIATLAMLVIYAGTLTWR